MRVNRETLLNQLEAVQPGLSPREIVEQSSCFVFTGNELCTYNDEASCRCPSPLGTPLEGAVQAEPLLNILRKLNDEEVEISAGDGELLIKGKRRRAGVRMEKDVLLPLDAVDKPKKWVALPDAFDKAVGMVQHVASHDETRLALTCVHIHPKWVEAADDFQVCRWRIKTGVTEPVLLRQSSIKHTVDMGVQEFSETPSWFHFRNANKLVLSCRRYAEEYPDISPILKATGVKVQLPKGLSEAAERAQVFSSENPENDHVLVELRPGKVKIRGQGASGWYTELKNIRYDGEPLSFLIAPALLADLVKRHAECEIGQERLKVEGDRWTYVTCLIRPEDAEAVVVAEIEGTEGAAEGDGE